MTLSQNKLERLLLSKHFQPALFVSEAADALTKNIRLCWKCLTMKNTLAYLWENVADNEKSFIR